MISATIIADSPIDEQHRAIMRVLDAAHAGTDSPHGQMTMLLVGAAAIARQHVGPDYAPGVLAETLGALLSQWPDQEAVQ